MSTYRTNTCGELTIKDLDKKVTLAGFVLGIRDHGGVMFIDLRDHYGVTQIVVHDDTMLKGVTKETVIKVTGKVVKRDIDTVNKKIPTGEIEVVVEENTQKVLLNPRVWTDSSGYTYLYAVSTNSFI